MQQSSRTEFPFMHCNARLRVHCSMGREAAWHEVGAVDFRKLVTYNAPFIANGDTMPCRGRRGAVEHGALARLALDAWLPAVNLRLSSFALHCPSDTSRADLRGSGARCMRLYCAVSDSTSVTDPCISLRPAAALRASLNMLCGCTSLPVRALSPAHGPGAAAWAWQVAPSAASLAPVHMTSAGAPASGTMGAPKHPGLWCAALSPGRPSPGAVQETDELRVATSMSEQLRCRCSSPPLARHSKKLTRWAADGRERGCRLRHAVITASTSAGTSSGTLRRQATHQ